MKNESPESNCEQAGWRVTAWTRLVGISRPFYYTLPPELQPSSVKVGKCRIIRESPKDWLARTASQQEAV